MSERSVRTRPKKKDEQEEQEEAAQPARKSYFRLEPARPVGSGRHSLSSKEQPGSSVQRAEEQRETAE